MAAAADGAVAVAIVPFLLLRLLLPLLLNFCRHHRLLLLLPCMAAVFCSVVW